MACGLSNGHVTDDVTWPWKVKLVTPIRLKRNISKTTWARDFEFGICSSLWVMPSGRTKISHKVGITWRLKFLAWSNISPKLLELETSNLVHGFVWRMTSRRTKISPKSGRGLGHVTPTIFGSTVGYPSDSLASCLVRMSSVTCCSSEG